jgi:hypothetical protein
MTVASPPATKTSRWCWSVKAMANHASTRARQFYDRRRNEMSLDEVERVVI